MKIFQVRRDGRYHASSASTPGKLYYVTRFGCGCKGFAQHGRCKHNAALMSALGWIDTTPEPEPTPAAMKPARFGSFNGIRKTRYTCSIGRGHCVYDWQTCAACAGTEHEPMPEAV